MGGGRWVRVSVGERGCRWTMTTSSVAGPGPDVESSAKQRWREACARASVILGVIGWAVLALVLVANLTFLMNGTPGVATQFQNEGGGVVAYGLGSIVVLTGVLTGFLGRRSRRRRTAVAGSVLSGVAFLGLAAAGFGLPYYTFVRGLAWSPDGTRIAFADAGIWVVSADGSSAPIELVQLASDSPVWSSPAWSPDGTRIAWAEDAGIWVVSAEGSSAPVQLAADGSAPAWSRTVRRSPTSRTRAVCCG